MRGVFLDLDDSVDAVGHQGKGIKPAPEQPAEEEEAEEESTGKDPDKSSPAQKKKAQAQAQANGGAGSSGTAECMEVDSPAKVDTPAAVKPKQAKILRAS